MLPGACSCWSVVCFVWLSGFHRGGGQSSEDRADHGAAEGHRATGPELRRQILCRFHKCLFIVRVCLLAFIHVCGPVPVRRCHPVSIIDSCWFFIFSASPVWQKKCLTPAASCIGTWGHSIRWIQKESNTGSRPERGFDVVGRELKHRSSIPSFNPWFLLPFDVRREMNEAGMCVKGGEVTPIDQCPL